VIPGFRDRGLVLLGEQKSSTVSIALSKVKMSRNPDIQCWGLSEDGLSLKSSGAGSGLLRAARHLRASARSCGVLRLRNIRGENPAASNSGSGMICVVALSKRTSIL